MTMSEHLITPVLVKLIRQASHDYARGPGAMPGFVNGLCDTRGLAAAKHVAQALIAAGVVLQPPERLPRVAERELTVTVTEHTWTTYRVLVSLDFDTSDYLAVEDLIVNADDELEYVEGAVEHREVTIDVDERVGDRSQEGDRS